MAGRLEGRAIAILATDGVEQVELVEPRKALEAEGADTKLISIKSGEIQGMNHLDKGDTFPVDQTLHDVEPGAFHAIMLPGGAVNPDTLRMNPSAVDFVRYFYDRDKPMAAICHAPWMLVEADVVRDLTLTSWPSLRTDIENAGGTWTNEQVIIDHGVVTSRKPADIPAFNEKMIEVFQEGRHKGRTKSQLAGHSTSH
jgi:protease I